MQRQRWLLPGVLRRRGCAATALTSGSCARPGRAVHGAAGSWLSGAEDARAVLPRTAPRISLWQVPPSGQVSGPGTAFSVVTGADRACPGFSAAARIWAAASSSVSRPGTLAVRGADSRPRRWRQRPPG